MSVCPETWVYWAGFLTRSNKAFLQQSKTNPGWLFSCIVLDICTSSVLQCSKFRRAIPESWKIGLLATCSYMPIFREREWMQVSHAVTLVGKYGFPLSLLLLWLFIAALRKQRAALPMDCSEFRGQLCSLAQCSLNNPMDVLWLCSISVLYLTPFLQTCFAGQLLMPA